MARFDLWLEQQRNLVDSNAPVQTIVLEGADGTTWGTWVLSSTLGEAIEGTLASLRDQLPRGKHNLKLLALAGDKSQVAVFPLTVVGASQEATDAAQQQLTLQRATALAISNMEQQSAGMSAALAAAHEREQRLSSAYADLLEQLSQMEHHSRDEFSSAARLASRDERLAQLLENTKPLFAVAAEMIGGWVAKQIAQSQGSGQKPEVSPGTTPQEPPKIPQPNAAESQGPTHEPMPVADSPGAATEPTTSNQPTESRASGADPSTGEFRSDGEGRSARNERSSTPASRQVPGKRTKRTI